MNSQSLPLPLPRERKEEEKKKHDEALIYLSIYTKHAKYRLNFTVMKYNKTPIIGLKRYERNPEMTKFR